VCCGAPHNSTLGAVIFAVETEEQTLYVFPDEAAGVAYCEGLDVEAATWLFWDAAGLPLEPEFITPKQAQVIFRAEWNISVSEGRSLAPR
jgi:hypothetical protein